jgi:hypothetical protein
MATFNSLEQAIKGDLLIEFCGIKVSSDVSNIGNVFFKPMLKGRILGKKNEPLQHHLMAFQHLP